MSTAGELTPTSRTVLASRLVGRARERELLEHAVAAARAGQGRSVVVLGEAGIGKSRLAREAEALAAEDGLRVLWGRAVETGTPVAFRPLAEALCGGVRSFGLPDSPELQPFRGALGWLVPEWRHGADPGASLVTLSEGILRFLRAIAGEHGCLLVLEDLHWSDPETLEVLQYLADNLQTERVLCVATARVDKGSVAIELARALEARRSATGVRLSTARPRSTRTPCSVARASASRARRDLPMPASPRTTTIRPCPPRAAATACSSSARSSARPTSRDARTGRDVGVSSPEVLMAPV